MSNKIIIPKFISQSVVMTGVYYKHNHPGGISSVVNYWSKYIEGIRYYPSFKEGNRVVKLFWYLFAFIRLLLVFIFDRRVKILHSHTAAGSDFSRTASFVKLAKIFRKKIIIHSHASMFKDFYNTSSKGKQKKILDTLNSVDIIIVLSDSWREWFSGIGVKTNKIVILHNITDYPIVNSVDKNESKLKLLFLGEIGHRKGVFDLLRAISEHHKDMKDKIELKIGGNKQEEKLLKAISENNLSDCVSFEGFVSGEKKNELLNWADIYVLPSYNEGLPISILEAMSYGMPIISTPVGGIPEVVDMDNGVLVTPGDSNGIYCAINKYVENPSLIVKQGLESERKATQYLPDFVMNALRNIYESLLR